MSAAIRVKKWLDDGCPSWGVPEADIRALAVASRTAEDRCLAMISDYPDAHHALRNRLSATLPNTQGKA